MVSRKMLVLFWCLLAGSAAADPVLRWAPADTTVNLGQNTALSIMLDDTLTVRTIEFYITYDSDILTTVGGGPGSLFDGFNVFSGFEELNPAEPGQRHGYCVILGADDWAVGPGELFRWTVRGVHVGTANLVTVTVWLLPPGGGAYEATVLPANTIAVSGPSPVPPGPAPAKALTLYPNPFNPQTTISLSGADSGDSRLEVFDLGGRRLIQLWQGSLPDGQAIPWDGRDSAGRLLPSGVYTFLLTGSDGQRTATRGTLLR